MAGGPQQVDIPSKAFIEWYRCLKSLMVFQFAVYGCIFLGRIKFIKSEARFSLTKGKRSHNFEYKKPRWLLFTIVVLKSGRSSKYSSIWLIFSWLGEKISLNFKVKSQIKFLITCYKSDKRKLEKVAMRYVSP